MSAGEQYGTSGAGEPGAGEPELPPIDQEWLKLQEQKATGGRAPGPYTHYAGQPDVGQPDISPRTAQDLSQGQPEGQDQNRQPSALPYDVAAAYDQYPDDYPDDDVDRALAPGTVTVKVQGMPGQPIQWRTPAAGGPAQSGRRPERDRDDDDPAHVAAASRQTALEVYGSAALRGDAEAHPEPAGGKQYGPVMRAMIRLGNKIEARTEGLTVSSSASAVSNGVSAIGQRIGATKGQGDGMSAESTGSEIVKRQEAEVGGFFAGRDAVYAQRLTEGATQDKYRFIPQAHADAIEVLDEVVPKSILQDPVGPTLRLAVQREAEAYLLANGTKMSRWSEIQDGLVEGLMPNKVEYRQQERKRSVAQQAGRRGVEEVVDLSIEDGHERSLAAVRAGLGAFGIDVHVNTLRSRLEVDGIDAAARIVEAEKIAADGASFASESLLGIHVATDEARRPGGQVKDFLATLLIRGSRNTRQLVTMRPVSVQSAGLLPEVTLAVEGIGVNPEIGEYVVGALRRGVEQTRTDLGNGVQQVTSLAIAADLQDMVRDLSDPQHVGVRSYHIRPDGRAPLQLEAGAVDGQEA